MDIKINYSKAVSQETVMAYKQQIAEAQTMLHNGTGKGNDRQTKGCNFRNNYVRYKKDHKKGR